MIVGCVAIIVGAFGCATLALGLGLNNALMQVIGVGIFASGALTFLWNRGRADRRKHRELIEAVKGETD